MPPRFLRAIISLCSVVATIGCTTTTPPAGSSLAADQSTRKIKVNTARTIKDNWVRGRLFAVIGPKGDSWELISVHTTYPARSNQQEVFLITRDLAAWETTIAPEKNCTDGETGYSVCTSVLAERGFFGAKHYNATSVRQAVKSISEEQARAVIAEFIATETASNRREEEEQAKRQAACYERHNARIREIEAAAGPAMAAAIAGKKLNLMERTNILRAQQVVSASVACGLTYNPPER